MRTQILVTIVFLITFSFLVAQNFKTLQPQTFPPHITNLASTSALNSSQFILMGDTGTGAPQQYAVANQISAKCAQDNNCQAVFILGDVIYEFGLKNLDDPQFQTKFVKPYANINLPFFIAYGNHDYLGCLDCYLNLSQKDSKWHMPSRYYNQKFPDITFYMIDTENFDTIQQQWLSDSIVSAQTKWKIVLGHRPLKTAESTKVKEKWSGMDQLQSIICQTTDFYITGHAHVLEDQGNLPNCRTHQLISGTGGSYPRTINKKYAGPFYSEENGFLSFQTDGNSWSYQFISQIGQILFQK